MQKLILFDFDGTLADTAPDLAATANLLRTQRGDAPLPYEVLRPVASQGARGLLRVGLDLDTNDANYAYYRDEFLRLYEQEMAVRSHIFPGMSQLLQTIVQHGHIWGIVTNKAERFTYPLLKHFKLENNCRVLVGGDTTPHIKPHPAPLLHAANQAGISPEACIYIGDDERDIIAGKAAGMPTIAAAWGYCNPAELPAWNADAIASTPEDIWPLLQRWL